MKAGSLLILGALVAACGGSGGDSTGAQNGSPAGSDIDPPSIAIASPTQSANYTTTASAVNLAGTAGDNVGVSRVTWSNSRGGSGTASGTTSWSISSVALQIGSNVITVSASDVAGHTADRRLTVIFSPPDLSAPTVTSTEPVSGAANVGVSLPITVTFNEPINAASVSNQTFAVAGVTGTVTASGRTATFTPDRPLADSTDYTATVTGGSGGVKDVAGNSLATTYSWTFSTSALLSCSATDILCVDDDPGPSQEYSSIQSAVTDARAGDTVLVYDGSYRGFIISRAGTPGRPIVIKAQGNGALINQPNGNGEGVTISNASHVAIEGFIITGMPGYGLATHNASPQNPMRGLVIRGNTVGNSSSTNIYLSQVADSLIERNSASRSVSSHGIYLANGGSDNTTLRSNHCFSNSKAGIHFNGDLSVGGDGYQTGLVIESNTLHDNGNNGLDMDGVGDSTVLNNLIYNNRLHALRGFREDAADGPRNLRIINNTMIQAAGGGGTVIKLTADRGGHTLFNNIIIDNGSYGSIVVASPGFHSDHNIISGKLSLDGEASLMSLAAWQSSGFDISSRTAASSDLFTNAGAGDFTLKSTAPAVDSGAASFGGSTAPLADIRGMARPQGSYPDAGAYESH